VSKKKVFVNVKSGRDSANIEGALCLKERKTKEKKITHPMNELVQIYLFGLVIFFSPSFFSFNQTNQEILPHNQTNNKLKIHLRVKMSK
jgi:hypothetical protein